jgi:hypothetical protein
LFRGAIPKTAGLIRLVGGRRCLYRRTEAAKRQDGVFGASKPKTTGEWRFYSLYHDYFRRTPLEFQL